MLFLCKSGKNVFFHSVFSLFSSITATFKDGKSNKIRTTKKKEKENTFFSLFQSENIVRYMVVRSQRVLKS